MSSIGEPQPSQWGPKSPSLCWWETSPSQVPRGELGLGSVADFLTLQGGWEPVPGGAQSLGSTLAFLCCSSSLGVAYTSECFPCKPGTYADKQGSSFCELCPANSYSNKGETSCHPCDPDKYSGEVSEGGWSLVGGLPINTGRNRKENHPSGHAENDPSSILTFWTWEEPCWFILHWSLWKQKWNHSASNYWASTICQVLF